MESQNTILARWADREAKATALPTREENDAALAVCRACEHFTENDPKRDGAPTCAECRSCKSKIVRFGLPRGRWSCPLGKWIAPRRVLWIVNAGIGDALMYCGAFRLLLDHGCRVDVWLMGQGCQKAAPFIEAMGCRALAQKPEDGREYHAIICGTRRSALERRARGLVTDNLINPTKWTGGPVAWARNMLGQLGVNEDMAFDAMIDQLPHARVPRTVVIGTGSGPGKWNRTKLWDGWDAFAEEAHRLGMELVTVGAADTDWTPPPYVKNLIGAHDTLDHVLDVFADAALYVGIDNGLGHLAGACGVPGLTIFTVTDPAKYARYGRVVRGVDGNENDGVQVARVAARMMRRHAPNVLRPRRLLSVVIGSYNEGEQVRLTCESVHKDAGCETEIIVVDDKSDDGSCDNLPDYVRVVSTPEDERMGVAPARNWGARYATGETITFLDGHMRTAPGALALMAREARERQACVAGCLSNLGGSDRVWYGSYAEIRRDKARLSSRFYRRPHPRPMWESPIFVAPGYALPRGVFERIGGWPDQLRGWGQTEITLAVKLWLAGVPMLVCQYARLQHKFKERFGYSVGNSEILRNNHIMCSVCFDEATNETFWRRLARTHRWWNDEIPGRVDADALAAEHEAFQEQRVRSDDAWFRAVLGMTIDEAKREYLP